MMKKILLKPFEELVIAWTKINDFQKTKIKLSFYYLLVVILVLNLFIFSLFYFLEKESQGYKKNIYTYFQKQETLYFDKNTSLTFVSISPVRFSKENYSDFINYHNSFIKILKEDIFWIELFLIFLSGFLSYILAGISLKPIENKNKEEKKLISDISHELKNPLSAIKMSLEISKKQKDWKLGEAQEVFSDLENEIDRLIKITKSILDLKKAEQENKKEKINLKNTIEKIIKKIEIFAQEKNIKIIQKLEDFELYISKTDIEILIYNLLHNAIKFSKNNGKIEISLNKKGGLKIKDFGIGMDKKEIKKIFNRFYKIDSAREIKNESGTGLGLSIVKTIVKKNNIRMKINSEQNKGTEFLLYFK